MAKKGKTSKVKRWLKRIVAFFLILLLLLTAGYVLYSKLKAEYTITYDSYTASVGTISNSLSFSGSLQLIDNATYTASSASNVRNVYVSAGQNVKEGDKLLRLSSGQTVEAEFDGRINQLFVAEGDKVASGDSLVQVADFEHMQVSIRVDEYDIADVQVGQKIRVTTTATENEYDSTIAAINYISASSGSVAYYTATAYVDVSAGIYPGMQVTITIPQEEAVDVVVLKMDALSFDAANQAFVYMQGEDGTMSPVYVSTGVSNGNYVEITSGLKAGDTVYVEAETSVDSGVNSLLSSIFGGQRINGGGMAPNTGSRTNNGGGTRNNTNGNAPGGNGTFNYGGGK